MNQDNGHLLSLNEKYLYQSKDGVMYAPLRVEKSVAKDVKKTIKKQSALADSCIEKISASWVDGKFIMTAEFKESIKCETGFRNPTPEVKNEICVQCLCDGKCTDEFMRNVVANKILPEFYNTKQK